MWRLCYTVTMGSVKKLFLLLVLFFLIFSLLKNFFEYRKNFQFYNNYKTGLDEQKKRNLELQTRRLQKTSLSEIEKTIRNKLGLLKPGEVSIIIPLPSPSSTPAITPPLPVYKQWWNVFFKEQ